jgi:prepilin-type N-terminal cleavage/methylation domain-containing protein
MMHREQSTKTAGFTLIELMIVVTLIGILGSIAIPGFLRYQMTSKRAEAYTNLVALAKAQKAYYAEFGTYISVLGEPITTSLVAPSPNKRPSGPVTTAFSLVGWTPEGNVYFDYDTCAPGGAGCACTCTVCFTAAAWSDLDDDGSMAGYVYFEPDGAGNTCQTQVDGHFPPVDGGGVAIVQTSAWHGNTDDF